MDIIFKKYTNVKRKNYRISKNKYKEKNNLKEHKKEKKELTKKKKIFIWLIVGLILVFVVAKIGKYIYKADGNIAHAAINMVADAVGDETPITALIMGVSEGIDTPLTDTIILVRI